jgi:hypothetical protein
MHNEKVNVANFITRDCKVNNMYKNINDDMKYVNKFMETYVNTAKTHK